MSDVLRTAGKRENAGPGGGEDDEAEGDRDAVNAAGGLPEPPETPGGREATGDEHEDDHAQYAWEKNIIAIFKIAMKSEKDVIQALLHEYTHATQDEKKMKEYRKLGYKNNPYEKAAKKAEKNWKNYL